MSHTGRVTPVGRASLVAAFAAGVLAAGGCSSSAVNCAHALCPSVAPELTYVTTINGQSASIPNDGHAPSFRVRPGEHLVITVAVTVPRHVRVAALWLGISTGPEGFGPTGPANLHPILAHSRQPLPAGRHTFRLRWRIPERRSGTSLLLVSAWSGHPPPADVVGPIAELILT